MSTLQKMNFFVISDDINCHSIGFEKKKVTTKSKVLKRKIQ